MKYTKTWISIEDQVKLLTESKELDCDDVDALKRALETVGYYRLSAYWYPYKIGDEAESWRAELEKLLEEFRDIDLGRQDAERLARYDPVVALKMNLKCDALVSVANVRSRRLGFGSGAATTQEAGPAPVREPGLFAYIKPFDARRAYRFVCSRRLSSVARTA